MIGSVCVCVCEGVWTHPGSADDLSQLNIHPVVTVDKMAVVCLSILQLHKLQWENNVI